MKVYGMCARAVAMAVGMAAAAVLTAGAANAQAPAGQTPFVPEVGQAGKDVVWVPTPPELVEKMLDLAKVTPQDFVMDLGSGDGRNIIAAARRGARSLGVEFNPEMVTLSTRLAREAGVADKAQFVQGDMYVADISKANVLALFLLPVNMTQLRPKFLDLQPGSRIVSNTFTINDWPADEQVTIDDCSAWCTALLYIVPAKVAGTWQLPQGELTLEQKFQAVSGSFNSGGAAVPVRNGRLKGDEISFAIGDAEYTGRVAGDAMQGTVKGSSHGSWSATRGK